MFIVVHVCGIVCVLCIFGSNNNAKNALSSVNMMVLALGGLIG